jgi:uncharacterized membrane protein YphA (DoxX/SURF4 family)
MTTGMNVDQTSTPKSAARFIPIIVRVLLGLGFTIFGLNGFLNFMPPPKDPMPEKAMAFASAMMNTGYMFKLVAGTQLVAGVLLLFNLFVPLALVLLMPIFVNIIAFHLFLAPAPGGFAPGIILMAMELYLAWVYRKAYRPMLVMKAKPNES